MYNSEAELQRRAILHSVTIYKKCPVGIFEDRNSWFDHRVFSDLHRDDYLASDSSLFISLGDKASSQEEIYSEADRLLVKAGMGAFDCSDTEIKRTLRGLQECITADRRSALKSKVLDLVEIVEEFSKGTGIVYLEAYQYRLRNALKVIWDGDLRYQSSPSVDSIHTVLFELHQTVLNIAGLKRNE